MPSGFRRSFKIKFKTRHFRGRSHIGGRSRIRHHGKAKLKIKLGRHQKSGLTGHSSGGAKVKVSSKTLAKPSLDSLFGKIKPVQAKNNDFNFAGNPGIKKSIKIKGKPSAKANVKIRVKSKRHLQNIQTQAAATVPTVKASSNGIDLQKNYANDVQGVPD